MESRCFDEPRATRSLFSSKSVVHAYADTRLVTALWKTTFTADRGGGGVAEVATYENTYW